MSDKTQPTLRGQIRAWWREEIEAGDLVDLKAATARGAARLRQDETFCARFLDEFLQPLVYDVGLSLLSKDRSDVLGPRRMTKTQAAAAIETEARDWSRWLEYDPASGAHVPLFEMTKEQGLAAAKFREDRTIPDLRRSAMLRLMAGRLKPGQRIGEVWTPEAATVLERRLIVGRPKVSLGPVDMPDLRTMKGAAD